MRITDNVWLGFPLAALLLLIAAYQGVNTWSFYGRAVETSAEITDFGSTRYNHTMRLASSRNTVTLTFSSFDGQSQRLVRQVSTAFYLTHARHDHITILVDPDAVYDVEVEPGSRATGWLIWAMAAVGLAGITGLATSLQGTTRRVSL